MCTQKQLDSIIRKIAKTYRAVYGDSLARIILYGSYARGDFRDDSDIDIVAIVNGTRKKLQDELEQVWDVSHDLGLEYGIIVSPTVIPEEEFERCREDIPYYRNIDKEGIVING